MYVFSHCLYSSVIVSKFYFFTFHKDVKINNLLIEGGYLNDNKSNDGVFGSIKLVIPLGHADDEAQDQKPFEYVSVRDKLYQPVKRENKIKVVKIATGVTVSGY